MTEVSPTDSQYIPLGVFVEAFQGRWKTVEYALKNFLKVPIGKSMLDCAFLPRRIVTILAEENLEFYRFNSDAKLFEVHIGACPIIATTLSFGVEDDFITGSIAEACEYRKTISRQGVPAFKILKRAKYATALMEADMILSKLVKIIEENPMKEELNVPTGSAETCVERIFATSHVIKVEKMLIIEELKAYARKPGHCRLITQ